MLGNKCAGRHQCYRLADCSAADLKRGQTKSGAARKICCKILVQRELELGVEHLENLFSPLNLSKYRNVQEILYVSVFSLILTKIIFSSKA